MGVFPQTSVKLPDDSKVYMGTQISNDIRVIDTTTDTVIKVIPVFGKQHTMTGDTRWFKSLCSY